MTRLLLACLTVGMTACAAPSPSSARITTDSGLQGYVALGDSLTAGVQSGGLTAESQLASYPAILGRLAKHVVVVPESSDPGCPAPLGGGLSVEGCTRANPREKVANFALPGARVADLVSRSAATMSGDQKLLYELVLGPTETQVTAALKSRPEFVSVWIGSNDVLGAALQGDPSVATPPARFESEYARLLDALEPSGASVVLLTVPDVTRVPALVPGTQLAQAGLGAADCRGSANRVPATAVLQAVLTGQGNSLSCTAPFALTPAEAQAIRTTVDAYNASLRRLAKARGVDVFDVAPLVENLQTPPLDLNASRWFGPDYSQDGVHPSSSAHARLARALGTFMNETYGLKIDVN